MCHTMIIGAVTVVVTLVVVGGIAYVTDAHPDDIHAASAAIDVMQLTKDRQSIPERAD
jgi:hypothetical protein